MEWGIRRHRASDPAFHCLSVPRTGVGCALSGSRWVSAFGTVTRCARFSRWRALPPQSLPQPIMHARGGGALRDAEMSRTVDHRWSEPLLVLGKGSHRWGWEGRYACTMLRLFRSLFSLSRAYFSCAGKSVRVCVMLGTRLQANVSLLKEL